MDERLNVYSSKNVDELPLPLALLCLLYITLLYNRRFFTRFLPVYWLSMSSHPFSLHLNNHSQQFKQQPDVHEYY